MDKRQRTGMRQDARRDGARPERIRADDVLMEFVDALVFARVSVLS